MFDVAYQPYDFDKLKMFNLNSEQLLTLLNSENFCTRADKHKLVEALKGVQKSREIKIFKERPEVMKAVRILALDHRLLDSFEKTSYVTSLIHATSRMKIDDE